MGDRDGGLLVAPAASAAPRIVADSAGRQVSVPARVERLMPAGPLASVLLYALAPEKLVGWHRALTDAERAFLPAAFARLPAVGRLAIPGSEVNVSEVNVEVARAPRPDVVVDYGQVTPHYVAIADRVQAETGIPYLVFEGRLDAIPETLERAGEVLGVPERGRVLAREARWLLGDVEDRVGRVPVAQRPGYTSRSAPMASRRSHTPRSSRSSACPTSRSRHRAPDRMRRRSPRSRWSPGTRT